MFKIARAGSSSVEQLASRLSRLQHPLQHKTNRVVLEALRKSNRVKPKYTTLPSILTPPSSALSLGSAHAFSPVSSSSLDPINKLVTSALIKQKAKSAHEEKAASAPIGVEGVSQEKGQKQTVIAAATDYNHMHPKEAPKVKALEKSNATEPSSESIKQLKTKIDKILAKHPGLAHDIDRTLSQGELDKSIAESDEIAKKAKEASEKIKEPKPQEDIFVGFFSLMGRFITNNRKSANTLYEKIRGNIDSIDRLSNLIARINTQMSTGSGDIDWTNNEEMKKMVDEARAKGVDIPEGYKWSKAQAQDIKENLQMKKESIDQMTQLDRTDMQRYFQQEAEYHQARSNVLKMYEKIMDTITRNMRP